MSGTARKVAAIASFLLGIVGVVGLTAWLLGMWLGPPAVVLGWLGRRDNPRKVLAWIGMGLGANLTFILIALLATVDVD